WRAGRDLAHPLFRRLREIRAPGCPRTVPPDLDRARDRHLWPEGLFAQRLCPRLWPGAEAARSLLGAFWLRTAPEKPAARLFRPRVRRDVGPDRPTPRPDHHRQR